MLEQVLAQLPGDLQALLRELLHIEVLLQWLVLALAALAAIWIAARLRPRLTDLGPRVSELALRLTLPLVLALCTSIAQGALLALEHPARVLAMATTLALTLAIIRLLMYGLKRALKPGPLLAASEHMIAVLLWGLAALHLLGVLPWVLEALDSVALQLGDIRLSLLSLLQASAVLALFLLIATLLSVQIERRVMAQDVLSITARVGVSKVLRFAIVVIAILAALNSVGIDLTTLTVFSGALGVGIGFGLQRTASNFISGFILVLDRSIRQGDVISVGNSFGWVQELRARYTVIASRDGVETLIPNENLITSEVINWSYSNRLVRLKVPVQISYNDDPEQAMAILVEVGMGNARVEIDPAPVARLMAFGDSGIDLELRVWIDDPEGGINNIRSELMLEIWKRFKELNITIPFPQRDLHLRSGDQALLSRIEALEQALATRSQAEQGKHS